MELIWWPEPKSKRKKTWFSKWLKHQNFLCMNAKFIYLENQLQSIEKVFKSVFKHLEEWWKLMLSNLNKWFLYLEANPLMILKIVLISKKPFKTSFKSWKKLNFLTLFDKNCQNHFLHLKISPTGIKKGSVKLSEFLMQNYFPINTVLKAYQI